MKRVRDAEERWYFHVVPSNDKLERENEKMHEVSNIENNILWTDQWQSISDKIENMKKISAIKAGFLHVWEMDRLKDAARHYINGEWLSTIAICGCICEFASHYLMEEYIEGLPITNQEKEKELEKKDDSTLFKRINKLFDNNRIDVRDKDIMHEIRKKRNEYLHLSTLETSEEGISIKDAAIQVLNLTVEMLNKRTS